MAGLAVALTYQNCDVTYVAEQPMSEVRASQGWLAPRLSSVQLALASSEIEVGRLVASAPRDSIHVCQGIRGNRLIGRAQAGLMKRGLRQWVVMEAVDDSGWRGFFKRLEYRRLFWRWRDRLQGVLATGHDTADWVVRRGMPLDRVFPFAYFLPESASDLPPRPTKRTRFRFVFVGRLVEQKRVDLLIAAMARLQESEVELAVIGSGPLEIELRMATKAALPPDRVVWVGRLPLGDVPAEIAKADCLVLPSRYDGWGAVVSEAIMVGTPVVCSDRCGSAGVVRASGNGGVFRSGDLDALVCELRRAMSQGRLSVEERLRLAEWGQCLGARAGASYLRRVLDHADGCLERPAPPWGKTRQGRRPSELMSV
jgi:glycosyltransferase involved in cell wall biosynthesis